MIKVDCGSLGMLPVPHYGEHDTRTTLQIIKQAKKNFKSRSRHNMLIQHSQATSDTEPEISSSVPRSTVSTATSPIDTAHHHVNHERDVHANSKYSNADNLPHYIEYCNILLFRNSFQ